MSGKRRSGKPPPVGRGGGGREKTVSKALTFLLRHGAEKEGLKINSQGYVNVADVVRETDRAKSKEKTT